jgi:hypothetical protein
MDTHRRTLAINLSKTTFGTFAEIGAGQEVARWFLQAGGASGTVAKTISAYDMTFSDAIYGKSGRYVSRERLIAMLDHEYALLLQRLDAARGAETHFFAFADTVSARNFEGTNECHGWMGLRFQTRPRGAPNDILLHVNMRDATNALQQQALGVLGVNLLYAAYHGERSGEKCLVDLFTDLSLDRIEIDVLEARGPDLSDPGPSVIGAHLVSGGYAQAVLIGREDRLLPPSEILRKRPILLERSTARRAPSDDGGRSSVARARLIEERGGVADPEPLDLRELSVQVTPSMAAEGAAAPSVDEVVAWAERRRKDGDPVALTRYQEPFFLTAYLRRFTQEPIRFLLPAPALREALHTVARDDLEGGLLEGLGKLLAANVKIYVLGPGARSPEALRLPAPLGHLYTYLLEAGWVVPLD